MLRGSDFLALFRVCIYEVIKMKRIFVTLLALCLLAGAAAAEGYNSFMDDSMNAGRYDNFAWDGEYAYWLKAPEGDDWLDAPANVYRMRPGDDEAEMILQGRDDLWIYSLMNIGDCLLLSAAAENSGAMHPVLLDFDGGDCRELSGSIGSAVMGVGAVYNSTDGKIYRISLKNMKPRSIFEYPAELMAYNPVLEQYADGKLYISTEEPAKYELNLDNGKLRRIAQIRGNGFVLDGMLYISDYDALDGTWKYDIDTGNRVKISDRTYDFKQGSGKLVRANGDDADSWFQGAVFDFANLGEGMEAAKLQDCSQNYDILLGGRMLHYDWEKNRVDWSDALSPEPAAE